MKYSKLKESCDVLSGFAFKSEFFNDKNLGMPLIRIRDLKLRNPKTFFSGDYSEEYIVNDGDLLVSMDGEFRAYLWDGPSSLLNQRVSKISVRDDCADLVYICYLINNELKNIENKTGFTTVKHLSKKDIENIEIPFPEKKEQRKIASALAEADSLIQKRKEVIAKLDELVQSVFIEMFGDPISNPKKWDIVKFGELLQNIDSGRSPICSNIPALNKEWGVLKLSSVTKGIYMSQENKKTLTGTASDSTIEVQSGDLLFTRKNTKELVGACAYVFDTPCHLMMPDTVFRFQFNQDASVNKLFIWGLFNNKMYKKTVIQKLAEGSAGSMPNISKTKLLEMEVLLPPIHIQQEYALFIKEAREQEAQMFLQLTKLEGNFQSLLHQAFTGRLQFCE